MKKRMFRDLRSARAGDQLDANRRALLVENARQTRAEIEQIFSDVGHWNRLHPTAEPIDADPDGFLRQIAEELDALLLREQSHTM